MLYVVPQRVLTRLLFRASNSFDEEAIISKRPLDQRLAGRFAPQYLAWLAPALVAVALAWAGWQFAGGVTPDFGAPAHETHLGKLYRPGAPRPGAHPLAEGH